MGRRLHQSKDILSGSGLLCFCACLFLFNGLHVIELDCAHKGHKVSLRLNSESSRIRSVLQPPIAGAHGASSCSAQGVPMTLAPVPRGAKPSSTQGCWMTMEHGGKTQTVEVIVPPFLASRTLNIMLNPKIAGEAAARAVCSGPQSVTSSLMDILEVIRSIARDGFARLLPSAEAYMAALGEQHHEAITVRCGVKILNWMLSFGSLLLLHPCSRKVLLMDSTARVPSVLWPSRHGFEERDS